jgi:hypothetical protein
MIFNDDDASRRRRRRRRDGPGAKPDDDKPTRPTTPSDQRRARFKVVNKKARLETRFALDAQRGSFGRMPQTVRGWDAAAESPWMGSRRFRDAPERRPRCAPGSARLFCSVSRSRCRLPVELRSASGKADRIQVTIGGSPIVTDGSIATTSKLRAEPAQLAAAQQQVAGCQ